MRAYSRFLPSDRPSGGWSVQQEPTVRDVGPSAFWMAAQTVSVLRIEDGRRVLDLGVLGGTAQGDQDVGDGGRGLRT